MIPDHGCGSDDLELFERNLAVLVHNLPLNQAEGAVRAACVYDNPEDQQFAPGQVTRTVTR